MTTEARFAVDLFGLVCLVWILGLVRSRRLYVGYAAIFILLIVVAMVTASSAAASAAVERAVAPFGVIGIAAGLLIVFLIYLCNQLTVIADRVNTVAQEMAIQHAGRPLDTSGAPDAEPRD
jgi:hypothetical protein